MPRRPAVALALLAAVLAPPPAQAAPTISYADRLRSLARERRTLARELDAARPAERAALLARAGEAARRGLVDELIPAWLGTRWAFHGTSRTPGQGEIACGYFVTTLLLDAGFPVERARLARLPSERMIRLLAEPADIARFHDESAARVVEQVRRRGGDGLYLVGLDFHTGFLVLRGGRADFCHSSWVDPPLAVTCEPATASPAFASRYRVVGRLLSERMVAGWLER